MDHGIKYETLNYTFFRIKPGENLWDLGLYNLDLKPKAQSIKGKLINCISSKFKTSALRMTLIRG